MLLFYVLCAAAVALWVLRAIQIRLRLSRAKHPSLQGHVRIARRLARLIPFYEYDEPTFYCCDGAPEEVAVKRRAGFERLSRRLDRHAPRSLAVSAALGSRLSDVAFVDAYRVPFQFRRHVNTHLPVSAVAQAAAGAELTDLDGNAAYDLTGSNGCNVFGYDFYKDCLTEGHARAQSLGPVLGIYHPVVADNAERLARIAGLDQVSFHMSGTEAVMQAVRLARYHTGRSHLVRFAGAYHGWWDGVQAGVGSQRPVRDVYTLKELDPATLKVLRTRRDIACVLLSPLQALHPNRQAPGDAGLINSGRRAYFDYANYAKWLGELRAACTASGIALIFDEIFSGFRLAYGGAQEYFGVAADLVTYGKTLGGGLPVGVVCGRQRFMQRFRDARPADLCFARGTFKAHPYVMTAMKAFLQRLEQPPIKDGYAAERARWDRRARALNDALQAQDLPVRIDHMVSVWSVSYTAPSRYNWMLQYYLRAHGLLLSWTGTGRLIMSHGFSEADFEAVKQRFVAAARAMRDDGWWWQGPGLTDRAIKRRVLKEIVAVRCNPGRAAGGLTRSMPRQTTKPTSAEPRSPASEPGRQL